MTHVKFFMLLINIRPQLWLLATRYRNQLLSGAVVSIARNSVLPVHMRSNNQSKREDYHAVLINNYLTIKASAPFLLWINANNFIWHSTNIGTFIWWFICMMPAFFGGLLPKLVDQNDVSHAHHMVITWLVAVTRLQGASCKKKQQISYCRIV